MKKITLPNNTFGVILMLALLLLIILVPLVIVGWLVSLIAPWWVAIPCAAFASLIVFRVVVKLKV